MVIRRLASAQEWREEGRRSGLLYVLILGSMVTNLDYLLYAH